jgi:hypothetical protein
VATSALVDPKTVQKRLRGGKVRPNVAARIDAALKIHNVAVAPRAPAEAPGNAGGGGTASSAETPLTALGGE